MSSVVSLSLFDPLSQKSLIGVFLPVFPQSKWLSALDFLPLLIPRTKLRPDASTTVIPANEQLELEDLFKFGLPNTSSGTNAEQL